MRFTSQLSTLAIGAALLTGCGSGADDARVSVFDQYFTRAFSNNADTLYARCYASLATSGNDMGHDPKMADQSNIDFCDNQTSDFIRGVFNLEELGTDEVLCAWQDGSIANLAGQTPNVQSLSTMGLYMRLALGVRLCDQYLNRFGLKDATRTAEVRLLRAIYHLYILDLYGNTSPELLPKGVSAYDFIESQTLEAMNTLPEAYACSDKVDAYGRMNKGVARMILSRLYLNSEVYAGRERWADALDQASTVINSKVYTLSTASSGADTGYEWSGYQKLFMADNGSNGANTEAILPIRFDGDTIVSLSGTTFLTASCFGDGAYTVAGREWGTETNGTAHQWSGNRARQNLVGLFVDEPVEDADCRAMSIKAADDRALFFSKGRTMNCADPRNFVNGYATTKFNNLYSDNRPAKDFATYSSADFFLIRLAEAYLTAAEAHWRMGNTSEALKNINVLRDRAHAARLTTISPDGHEIIDEWSREFYFEGRRRTDLIRFGQFAGSKARTWEWKGGAKEGQPLADGSNIYIAPDTAYISQQIEQIVANSTNTSKPTEMYYIIGEGIGERHWMNGTQDLGLGLIPFVQNGRYITLTEYLTTDIKFKLVGKLGSWDEQYGMGANGNLLHNDGGSGNISVPRDGLYTITVDRETGEAKMEPCTAATATISKLEVLMSDGTRIAMRPCNTGCALAQSWTADVPTGVHGYTRCKLLLNGEEVNRLDHRYGLTITYDAQRFMMFRTAQGSTHTRFVYNAASNACYFADIMPE